MLSFGGYGSDFQEIEEAPIKNWNGRAGRVYLYYGIFVMS